jgi:hypothetical protein
MRKSHFSIFLVMACIGISLGSGYWLGTANVPEDPYVRENLWCVVTDVVRDDDHSQWNITATFENYGRDDSTILSVYINGKIPTYFVSVHDLPLTLKGHSGSYEQTTVDSRNLLLTMKYGILDIISNSTIEIIFHSSAGQDYPMFVTLP